MEGLLEQSLDDELNTIFNGSKAKQDFQPDNDDDETFRVFHDEEFFSNRHDHAHDELWKMILYAKLGEDNYTRVWDLVVLLPNLCFFLFLLFRRWTWRTTPSTPPPMTSALYHLVLVSSLASIARCIVSIFDSHTRLCDHGCNSDWLTWWILRIFLSTTEIFAFATALLDYKASVCSLLLVSFATSIIFGSVQLTILLTAFRQKDQEVLGHSLLGGRIFWSLFSGLFASIYLAVVVAPRCRGCQSLAHVNDNVRRYSLFLGILNVGYFVSCILPPYLGLCLVSVANYIYFVAFLPVVYFALLAPPTSQSGQSESLFSYKVQTNEMDDEGDDHRRSTSMTLRNSSSEDQEQNSPIIITTSGLPSVNEDPRQD